MEVKGRFKETKPRMLVDIQRSRGIVAPGHRLSGSFIGEVGVEADRRICGAGVHQRISYCTDYRILSRIFRRDTTSIRLYHRKAYGFPASTTSSIYVGRGAMLRNSNNKADKLHKTKDPEANLK
jgi:hypothetical protein